MVYAIPARYPDGFDIPGFNERHPDPTNANSYTTVCTTFVEGLLVQSWNKLSDTNKTIIEWSWDEDRHKQSQTRQSINQMTYYQWEAVNVYTDTHMAEAPYSININSYSNIPKPWSVCNMWPYKPDTTPYINGSTNPGHNFIIVDVHKYSGKVLVLESRGSGMDASQSGPQYRWIGNVGDNMPGQFWYTDKNCWEIRKFYAYLKYNKMAQLRIYNRTFIENSTEDDSPDHIKNGIYEGGY